MIFRFLPPLALWAARRYRLVFAVSAVLVALSVGLITRLHLDTDILNLLPRKDPKIAQFLEAMERFGGADYLLVAVRVPEGQVVDPYTDLVEDLGARLAELPEIEEIDFSIGAPEELLESLYPRAVLFLNDEERAALAERLTEEGLERRAQELRRMLTTPQALALKELVKLDPFGLAELFLDRMETTRGGLAVDWTSGYYLSRDQRMLLLLATPVAPPQDTEFDVRLVAAVEEQTEAALADWGEIVGDDPQAPPAPEIVLGGTYLTALDDYQMIRRDVIVNLVTSVTLVLALFLLAFRRLGPLLYAIVPLATGLLLMFGFAAVGVGTLSSATSGTAALLIGLGIDFVIVSYGRYVEERRAGKDMEEALSVMAATSGRAVVVGAVTTAATFYAFLVTDFVGLRQMGLLTGTGILFCMVSVLVLLPALISWGEHRHRRRETSPNLYLHSFGTGKLLAWCTTHPRTALAVGALFTLAAAGVATGLEFEEGMESMRPPEGNRGIAVAAEVAERFDSGFDSMMLVVRGDDLDTLFERIHEGTAMARQLVDEEVILGYGALDTLVPSPQSQREAIEWLERGRQSGLLDEERIAADFRAALAAEGLRAEPFERGLELFGRALEPREVTGPEGLADAGSQAGRLLDRYLQRDGDGWVSVVYLYPPRNIWRREPPPRAMELADELGPGLDLTGTNVVNALLRAQVRRDAVMAAVLGFLLVGVLLWIDFRSLRDAILSLIPLLVGLVWMLGAMVLVGIDMNFMNVFVSTMIIGIGVDYGIHAVHRWREVHAGRNADNRNQSADGLVETGKAIVVAALSTVVGFGSLATSSYPGLRSTGLVAILGAIGTALVAITLLPALLAWREGRALAPGRGGAPKSPP